MGFICTPDVFLTRAKLRILVRRRNWGKRVERSRRDDGMILIAVSRGF